MKFGDETERARKGDDGVCGRGRKWRSCERVRGISSVIWRRGEGREDRGGERGRQFSRDDTEVRSVSGVDTRPFWTLRVDRVNTWT